MRPSSAPSPAVTYDPFGEPVAAPVACADGAGDRAARRVGAAVFWSLALAILAGRIYAYDLPAVSQAASYAAQVLALR